MPPLASSFSRLPPQSAESLPIAFGLVIAFSCTLSWCPRWAIVPAIAFAVAFDCAQLHDDRPAPILMARYTGHRVKAVAPARHNAGNCTLCVGCGFPGDRGFHFLITAGVDQFTAVNPLQIIWVALVTSGVVSLLPTWKPLEAVGRHGFTLNLVAAVVATWFGSTSATFTRISALRGLGIAPPQTFDPLGNYSLLLHGYQNWWMGLIAVACCVVAALQRGWGPLEKVLL